MYKIRLTEDCKVKGKQYRKGGVVVTFKEETAREFAKCGTLICGELKPLKAKKSTKKPTKTK
jgi:hypothetical protein